MVDVGSPKSTNFHWLLPHKIDVLRPSSHFLSSKYTEKNRTCLRCANNHSQFGTFFLSKSLEDFYTRIQQITTVSSMLDQDLEPIVSWLTYPKIWTFWLWNFEQFWSIFHFDLGVSRYCTCCLSCTSWWPCYDIHYFCSRHADDPRSVHTA